jgi:hypothetical protein
MPSTLIPARVHCGLRFASRLLPGLHIREDHLRRNHHAEPGHDHSGDRGGPARETGSAAGGGRDAQAARVPGISPNTARAALAGDGPPRGVRRPAGSVADEVEPRVWPYRLPAGWRRVTELDGPAVSAQKCRDGSQDRPHLPVHQTATKPAQAVTSSDDGHSVGRVFEAALTPGREGAQIRPFWSGADGQPADLRSVITAATCAPHVGPSATLRDSSRRADIAGRSCQGEHPGAR